MPFTSTVDTSLDVLLHFSHGDIFGVPRIRIGRFQRRRSSTAQQVRLIVYTGF